MKTKTFKSVMTIVACIALILLAGFVLTACGSHATIYATNHVTPFNGVDFENTSDFELEKVDDNNYKAVGTAATMTAEQAAAWGTEEGAKYVIISIEMEVGSTIESGWVSIDNKDQAFVEGDGHKDTVYEGEEGIKEYVLGVNGTGIDHSDAPVWRVEVTAPVAEGEEAGEPVVYVVDFTEMIEAILAA